MAEQWNGIFDEAAYAAARRVLRDDHERATREMRAVLASRGRIVAAVAFVWLVCTIALAFASADLLLIAEIGWVLVIVFAVWRLLPVVTGRANLDEVYEAYENRLDELQQAQVPLPEPADMPDLVAALDFVRLPE